LKRYDDLSESSEPFSKRKDRRKPKGKGRRSVNKLKQEGGFDDSGLQRLFEQGLITELLGELKSGKEATVYLARGPQGLVAAKLYRDAAVRSFKNDQLYRDGRFIGDARIKKAIEQRSKTGMSAQQALWIMHEYLQLWALHDAGIPAPKPLVGPGADDCAKAGRVVLMEFIGDDEGAAPRLSDVRLSPPEAENAFKQSVTLLTQLLELGKIHGDFSAYNLLWWQGRVIVIDVPQTVEVAENPNAAALLERDVVSLCRSLKSVQADPREVLARVRRDAHRGE
jgi:RIO kinase 1